MLAIWSSLLAGGAEGVLKADREAVRAGRDGSSGDFESSLGAHEVVGRGVRLRALLVTRQVSGGWPAESRVVGGEGRERTEIRRPRRMGRGGERREQRLVEAKGQPEAGSEGAQEDWTETTLEAAWAGCRRTGGGGESERRERRPLGFAAFELCAAFRFASGLKLSKTRFGARGRYFCFRGRSVRCHVHTRVRRGTSSLQRQPCGHKYSRARSTYVADSLEAVRCQACPDQLDPWALAQPDWCSMNTTEASWTRVDVGR